jgi:hypothetical protein
MSIPVIVEEYKSMRFTAAISKHFFQYTCKNINPGALIFMVEVNTTNRQTLERICKSLNIKYPPTNQPK